jgi:hypothetical protein
LFVGKKSESLFFVSLCGVIIVFFIF